MCIRDRYRKGNAILHHGSILFNTNIKSMVESITVSEEKIIAKGIKSVRERGINVSEVMLSLIHIYIMDIYK